MPSASRLYFFNKSKYSPPVLKYLSGRDIDKCLALFSNKAFASETALLKPPIAECSSTVMIKLLFSEYLLMAS